MRSLLTTIAIMFLFASVAGCGSSGESASCTALKTDMTSCMTDYCANEGSGKTVCTCWNQGKDTNQINCECADLDWGGLCDQAKDYVAGNLNCAAVKSSLETVCP